MTKKDDYDRLRNDIEELTEWKREKEIEDGIRRGLTRWAHTICVTSTSALIGVFYWLGNFIYKNWEPLAVASKAFLVALRGGQ